MHITRQIIKLENKVNEIAMKEALRYKEAIQGFTGKVLNADGHFSKAFRSKFPSNKEPEGVRVVLRGSRHSVWIMVDCFGPSGYGDVIHYAKRTIYLDEITSDNELEGKALDVSHLDVKYDYDEMREDYLKAKRLREKADELVRRYVCLNNSNPYFV